MTTAKKTLGIVAVLAALLSTLAFTTPASAFEGRGTHRGYAGRVHHGRAGLAYREGHGFGRWHRPNFRHARRYGWR